MRVQLIDWARKGGTGGSRGIGGRILQGCPCYFSARPWARVIAPFRAATPGTREFAGSEVATAHCSRRPLNHCASPLDRKRTSVVATALSHQLDLAAPITSRPGFGPAELVFRPGTPAAMRPRGRPAGLQPGAQSQERQSTPRDFSISIEHCKIWPGVLPDGNRYKDMYLFQYI